MTSASKWGFRRAQLPPGVSAIYCEPETGEIPVIVVAMHAGPDAVADLKEQHNKGDRTLALLPGIGVILDLLRRAAAFATPVAVAGTVAVTATTAPALVPLLPDARPPLGRVALLDDPGSRLVLDPIPTTMAVRSAAPPSTSTLSASPSPPPTHSPSPTPTPDPTVTAASDPFPTPTPSHTRRHPRASVSPSPVLATITVSPAATPQEGPSVDASASPTADLPTDGPVLPLPSTTP